MQPASSYDEGTMDVESYYCSTPLHVRGEHLDPTLALGFYCETLMASAIYLLERALAEANVAAPILLVRTPTVPTVEEQSVRPVPERDDEFSDWEFVCECCCKNIQYQYYQINGSVRILFVSFYAS